MFYGYRLFIVSERAMNLITFECSKCRDGYRVITKPAPIKTDRARRAYYLVAASDRFERYSPLEHFPALFANFVETPADPEGHCHFANNFGLISSSPDGNTTEEMVLTLLNEQKAMKQAVTAFEMGEKQKLVTQLHKRNNDAVKYGPLVMPGSSGLAQLELRLGESGEFETIIVPSSLLQAMWVQFVLHAASGAHLFRCERCRKPFVVGAGTKRRSTSKYCSNACKLAAFKTRHEA